MTNTNRDAPPGVDNEKDFIYDGIDKLMSGFRGPILRSIAALEKGWSTTQSASEDQGRAWHEEDHDYLAGISRDVSLTRKELAAVARNSAASLQALDGMARASAERSGPSEAFPPLIACHSLLADLVSAGHDHGGVILGQLGNLERIMNQLGARKIDPHRGATFDAVRHRSDSKAVATEVSDDGDTICDVLSPGWEYLPSGAVMVPASVSVFVYVEPNAEQKLGNAASATPGLDTDGSLTSPAATSETQPPALTTSSTNADGGL